MGFLGVGPLVAMRAANRRMRAMMVTLSAVTVEFLFLRLAAFQKMTSHACHSLHYLPYIYTPTTQI